MSKVRLLHGKPLLVGGKVATTDGCCCGSPAGGCSCALQGDCPHSVSISIKFDANDTDESDFLEFLDSGESEGVAINSFDNGDGTHSIEVYSWGSGGNAEFIIPDGQFFGVYHNVCLKIAELEDGSIAVAVQMDDQTGSFDMTGTTNLINTLHVGSRFDGGEAHRSIQCVHLFPNPTAPDEPEFSFPTDPFDSFTGSASIVDGLLRIDGSGDSYATKTLSTGYDLVCNCCPGCTSFSISAILTMSCTVEGSVICGGSGTIDFFSPTQCQYDGGFNASGCDNMPVVVNLRFYQNTWHIFVFINADGVCSFNTGGGTEGNQWCAGFSPPSSCLYIPLTTGCDPSGTYLLILANSSPDPSSDTCFMNFTIAKHGGACCDAFDDCTQQNETCCDNAGGTFKGYGVDCDPNPCVEATGACCTPGGDCDITTATICALIGGTYQGDGTVCSPSPLLSQMKFAIMTIVEAESEKEAFAKRHEGTVHAIKVFSEVAAEKKEVVREPWPTLLLPIKLLAKEGDRGAGDIIARTIGPIGGDAFRKWYKTLFGKSCGCGHRQEILNRRWPL